MAENLEISELRKLQKQDLLSKVSEQRKEFFDLKFQKKASGIPKPHMISVLKRNIARLMTVMNEVK